MNIVFFIASFVIGFLFGKGFAMRTDQKIEQETSEVRKQQQLILRSMELDKPVKFWRDNQGNIRGNILDINPNDMKSASSVSSSSIEKFDKHLKQDERGD